MTLCTHDRQSSLRQFSCDIDLTTTDPKDAIRQAIQVLKTIKKEIEGHQKTVRIFKTVGAVGNIIGTALLFTPAFYLGAALSAAATVTIIAVDIRDSFVNSKKGQNIFNIMEIILNKCMPKRNINIAELGFQKQELPKKDVWYLNVSRVVKFVYHVVRFIINSTVAMQYISASEVGRGALTLHEIAWMPAKIGQYAGSTAREAFTTLRGWKITGETTCGVLTVLFDVWTLVKTWRTENPSLQSVKATVKKLENFESHLQAMQFP